ncbi:MAG: fused response regulator/phosphatase [Planctomycetia bacterium]|nr:fused response regulator/phosphatase [Planctomycetia bacterium]
MQVLVGWDDPGEAETIGLFLNVEPTSAVVCTTAEEFARQSQRAGWDVAVQALNFPSPAEAFALFQKFRERHSQAPVIGVCRQGEIIHLAKFISAGLHSYAMRDAAGEFIFLLTPMIETAYTAVQAQRARQLAERLREEIDSVRRLQESVIPHDLPSPPGYAVAARYEPSQIRVLGATPVLLAGGDYYDVFNLDDETVVLLVGDAAGHGVKACMSIMTMHTLIRMIRGQRYTNTAEFVAEVNRRLCQSDVVQDEGGFITLIYSSLNTATHRLDWTSAGHPMPLLHRLETNEVVRLGTEEDAGFPLAIEESAEYRHCSALVPPRSRLLIYSDGIAEAFQPDQPRHEQFGEAGIIRTLKECRDAPLAATIDRLFADSHSFTAGVGRHDDTSVVLIERVL